MQATVEFTQESQVRWDATWRDLAQLARLGKREAAIVADAGRRGLARNFEREESPDGTPWHPLAAQTQAERRAGIDARGVRFRVGGEHPILKRTGDLLLSFVDADHAHNVTRVQQSQGVTAVTLGAVDDPQTPGRIALLHSGGRNTGGRYVPARPFVGWSRDAVAQVDAQARAVVNQRIERAGR